MIFEAWDGGDPFGTKLGDLTDARKKEIYVEYNGAGSGKFEINRHSAQLAWCAQGTFIRVRRVPAGPYEWAFWIEEGEDVTVSKEGEGGEVYTRGGRGPEAYLERALVYPTETLAGDPSPDADGDWHFIDIAYGAILNRMIADAKARTPDPLEFLTDTISATLDSAGAAWPAFDGEITLGAGMTMLAVVKALRDQGLIVRVTPGLQLEAYNALGENLTATVRFEKGKNIRESAGKQIHASPIKSRVLVQGGDAQFVEVTDGQTATLEASGHPVGRREGFTIYGRSASPAVLTRAGETFLRKQRLQHDGPATISVAMDEPGVPAGFAFLPFDDYNAGDSVTVDIPGEWDDRASQIVTITVTDSEQGAGDDAVTLGFDEIPYDPMDEMRAVVEEAHGPGCKPGCGHAGGAGDGAGAGDAAIIETLLPDVDMYGMSLLDGEFGFASWQGTATGFESTPTVGLGAGIAREYNESFAVCWPSNNAHRGSGIGVGQLVVDLVGQTAPAVPLAVRMLLSWDLSDNSLRVCQTPEGLTGIGDGAAVLTTPGLFEVRVLPPGVAMAQADVYAGAAVGLFGGSNSGSVEILVPARYAEFGDALGFRLVIFPLWEAEWAGWSCKAGFDRTGIESFIHLSATAEILEADGAGWVTAGAYGVQDGSNTDFTLAGTVAEVEDVFVNGILQPETTWDFDSGAQLLSMVGWAPIEPDLLEVKYRIE